MVKRLMQRRSGEDGSAPRPIARAFGAFKDAPLRELEAVIIRRKLNPDPTSYTSKIVVNPKKIKKKVMEEALELVTARGKENVIWEAADLLYFTVVYLVNRGVRVGEVLGELARRRASVKGGRDGQCYAPIPD